jgi:hypothetical protein
MPDFGFDVGIGPHSLRYIPTTNVLSPADTNSTNKLVKQDAPMRWAREGASGYGDRAVLCAVDEIPELIALARVEVPGYPVGAIMVPNAVANSAPSGDFVYDLPYSGAVPAGDNLGILADGAGAYKIVAAGGVGRVLKAAGGRMTVQF